MFTCAKPDQSPKPSLTLPLSPIFTAVNLYPNQALEKTISELCQVGVGIETQFLSLCLRIWISQALGQ